MTEEQDQKKTQTISEILGLGTAMSRLFSSPDLDQWRQLNVPVAQLKSLFLVVNRPGINSRILARELGVTPGNVTGIVDRLAEQGLVIRKPDPLDRRVIWIEATSQGQELFQKLVERHSRKFALILGFLDIKELEALETGLKGVVTALEKHLDVLKTVT
jgi:MarR family transcriptional regulator, organic hydroperoxide resistance regulator